MFPITCVVCVSVLGLVDPSWELSPGGLLTVRDAEFAAIQGPGQPELVEGVPIMSDNIGWGGALRWELAPGTYAVTAFSPPQPDKNVPRARYDWEIVVEAPPPPTRLEQIRIIVNQFFAAIQAWEQLDPPPTPAEIFQSMLLPQPQPQQ